MRPRTRCGSWPAGPGRKRIMAEREQLVWPVGQEVLPEGGGFESPVVLPATSLLHHRARVLDPTTAPQPGSTRRNRDLSRLCHAEEPTVDYQPTVYVTNQVLVSVDDGVDLVDPLVTAFNRRVSPIRLVPDAFDLRRAGDLAEQRAAQQDDERLGAPFPLVVRLRLVAEGDEVAEPPDAWRMVQRLRDALADEGFRRGLTEDQEDTTDPAELRRRDELRERAEQERVQVGLNHLLFAAQVGGVGFSIGHSAGGVGFSIGHGFSVGHSTGPSEYAVPGLGGRAPVRWVGRPPARTEELPNRPVVAILDTGVARHPWFDDAPAGPIVERLVYDSATRTVSA